MSVNYKPILWNKQKKRYDSILWLGILLFFVSFVVFQLVLRPNISIETIIIRGSGLAALILLHIILMIGPLARINSKFLPLLYNRRHMGVSMFILALIHGVFCIIQFHALGDTNAFVSIFTSNQKYGEINQFPFQTLGFLALGIFFLMAATSHDFWLKNLSAKVWKTLHMSVYLAYGLILVHVATGAFQYEDHPANWIALGCGFLLLAGLHLYTGINENRKLKLQSKNLHEAGFYKICAIDEIDKNGGKSVFINGENIAIFKYDQKVSAVHNVCKHQLGPLGEGRVVDGCITCPWHGYQYHPENGRSPAPFNELLCTYEVKVLDGIIWVNPKPKPEGTLVEPATITP